MVSTHYKTQPDEYGTEPAVKPKRREAPGRQPKEGNKQRGDSRVRNNVRTAGDGKNAPLLAEKESASRRTRRDMPPGERRVRALASPGNSPSPSLYDYAPPPTSSPVKDRYIIEIPSDDAATASSSVYEYVSPKNRSQVDAILSPRLSMMTSYTSNSYTDGGSALNATFTDTEPGLSSDFGTTRDEDDFQTMATGYTEEYEDSAILSKYKSQSTEEGGWSAGDISYVPLKQKIAGLSITVSAMQLAILLIQLCLCGLASIEVNPMIGPYPDAFSEWGGKNAYLMLEGHQYFRLFTPVFLHVGIVHMLVNAFCQLQICAMFERQWGSATWLTAYIISGTGAVATSCVMNPDEIGVSSSGALMGLFGAKIAQIVTYNLFTLDGKSHYEDVRVDRLGGVLCGASITFLFAFFTYIDLSGHLGGLAFGFMAGVLLFCHTIESGCVRFLWALFGFGGVIGGATALCYLLWVETYPDEELGDACQYFRNLYPEGYVCECQWG
jgi:membrane associated rhomboid family serine protease